MNSGFHLRLGSQLQLIPLISLLLFLNSPLVLLSSLIKASDFAIELPLFIVNRGQLGTETDISVEAKPSDLPPNPLTFSFNLTLSSYLVFNPLTAG